MKIEEMIAAERADCSGCSACANICPKDAITMTRDAEGFAYPKINPDLCIKCGRCDATCPALNAKKNLPDALPKVFVATYPDEKVLRHSSAGGVFSALSEIILREGGIIFGAGFDKKFHVHHTAAHNLDELENLRRSKYVQSQIGDVYRQVRDALKSQKVFFCGTPCQCAGLKHFLGGDPDNLLTADLVCHGAPSPALWEYYIGSFNDAQEVAHINFRSKRTGWKGYRFEINFKDRVRYSNGLGADVYGKFFLDNLTLRPSCYSCKFKFPNRQADLTLGDAWGVQNYAPEMFDNRGTSLVIVHTAKGKDFFERLTLNKKQVDFNTAIRSNPSFIIPWSADTRRKSFFDEFSKSDNKVAVLQKYFEQDKATIRKEPAKPGQTYNEIYRGVVEHIRKQFKRNILIVGVSSESFKQQLEGCGVYVLKVVDGKIICTEEFSSLAFEQKDLAALNDFAKRFNVTEVFVGDLANAASVEEWIKTCDLPVQTLKAK